MKGNPQKIVLPMLFYLVVENKSPTSVQMCILFIHSVIFSKSFSRLWSVHSFTIIIIIGYTVTSLSMVLKHNHTMPVRDNNCSFKLSPLYNCSNRIVIFTPLFFFSYQCSYFPLFPHLPTISFYMFKTNASFLNCTWTISQRILISLSSQVPLVVFKREKEIARKLEFDGLYITEQPSDDDIKGQWDRLVINTP